MSDVGADLYGQAAASRSSDGITAEAQRVKPVIGTLKPIADGRLIRYDRLRARGSVALHWEVTIDSQMSASEAGDTLEKIFVLFRLEAAPPEVHEAFLEAMLFAHTLNGASVLQPGRAKFSLGANYNPMDFGLVVTYLGVDIRRFFRAFANETREVNKRVLLAANNPHDVVTWEKAAWLRNVAAERGMSRHPDLAHDTADACTDLTDAERAALNASKAMIFASGVNMADRARYRPVQSQNPASGSVYEDPTARAHALAVAK